MKFAAVYRRKGMLIVHPYNRATTGVWILGEPVVSMREDADPLPIGNAVRSALDASRGDMMPPSDWLTVMTPLLTAAKAKSWGVFVRDASLCEIEDDGRLLSILPRANLGAREGFQPIDGARFTIASSASAEDLRAAVKRGLDAAE